MTKIGNKMGENLQNFGFDDDFLDITIKAQATEEKYSLI